MEVIIVPNADDAAQESASVIVNMLHHKPGAVLGLATGSTPIAMYRELVALCSEGHLSFADVSTFNLDEYIGLQRSSHLRYRHFMAEHLFNHIDIDPENTHFPECPEGQDPRTVGPGYEQAIAKLGGIDLQVLGLGANGHIGFNEPSSSLGSRTRVKTLAPRTIEDNSRLLMEGETQPELALTMGIGTIMDARRIMLLATGEHKAQAIAEAIEGAISAMHPASILQTHQRVRVIIDEAAASELQHRDYYRWVKQQSDAIASKHGGSGDDDPWFHTSVDQL
jgi:glucosamine-6-phosphate deaminase